MAPPSLGDDYRAPPQYEKHPGPHPRVAGSMTNVGGLVKTSFIGEEDISVYSKSAGGLRRPRIFRAGFGGPATRGSLLPNRLLEPRRWAAGGSAPMAAGRTLQYPRRSCVRVFGPAWRFQSCAFVLQAATRSDVMRVADSLLAGLNSLSVPEVFRQRSSRRFHKSGVVALHMPVELRSDSTRAEFGCDCFFRNGTTRAGNL